MANQFVSGGPKIAAVRHLPAAKGPPQTKNDARGAVLARDGRAPLLGKSSRERYRGNVFYATETMMLSRFLSLGFAMMLALFVTACATPGSGTGEIEIRQGKIEQITPVELQNSRPPGVGAVVGGLAGLGIGSLIGGGSGRDVAMVLGTIGGAVAGHQVQKRYDQPEPGQQIIVRLSNGVLVSITQPANPALRQGQAVFVEGSGQDARVVPR
jgi:outer membrane lipoprotein SlyB